MLQSQPCNVKCMSRFGPQRALAATGTHDLHHYWVSGWTISSSSILHYKAVSKFSMNFGLRSSWSWSWIALLNKQTSEQAWCEHPSQLNKWANWCKDLAKSTSLSGFYTPFMSSVLPFVCLNQTSSLSTASSGITEEKLSTGFPWWPF